MQVEPPPLDVFPGHLIRVGERPWVVLVVGQTSGELSGALLYQGNVFVGYAVAFLYEQDAILPQLVIDDFRREHHGEAALDFMLRRGNVFPRADVVGQRVSTGEQVEVFLKQLDLAHPVLAIAYASREDRTPLAWLDLVLVLDKTVQDWSIIPVNDERVPAILRCAVPCCCINPSCISDLPALVSSLLTA